MNISCENLVKSDEKTGGTKPKPRPVWRGLTTNVDTHARVGKGKKKGVLLNKKNFL